MNPACEDLSSTIFLDKNGLTDGNHRASRLRMHVLQGDSDMEDHSGLNEVLVVLIDQKLVLLDPVANLREIKNKKLTPKPKLV